MEYFVKVSYFQGVTKRSNYDMLFLLAYAENVNVFIFLSISFSILYFSGKGTCIFIGFYQLDSIEGSKFKNLSFFNLKPSIDIIESSHTNKTKLLEDFQGYT